MPILKANDSFPTDTVGQRESDNKRKIKMAMFAVKWKKQIVKLYAIAKWARDAHIVQKCMVRISEFSILTVCVLMCVQNITAFLLSQNMQFEDVVNILSGAKEELSAARCAVLIL